MHSLLNSTKLLVRDSYYELHDIVIRREEASEDLLTAPTPSDRWFTPRVGWPEAPVEMPDAYMAAAPKGYTLQKWTPPPRLSPTADLQTEAKSTQKANVLDELFEMRDKQPSYGELRVEVLEAEGLPNSLLQGGVVDPYALVIFETCAARTSQVRNDTTPRWGAEAPRAFMCDVRCPYSMLHVVLLDEDLGQDDPLGRVVISICDLMTHTTYDCWWPLQFGASQRHVKRRGAVRLRISVLWEQDRQRLFRYGRVLPTFVLPLRDAETRRNVSFAVRGRMRHPALYRQSIFLTHIKDLRKTASDVAVFMVDFFFWRWSYANVLTLIGWQLLISYPTEILAFFPLVATFALLNSYAGLAKQPKQCAHPLPSVRVVGG